MKNFLILLLCVPVMGLCQTSEPLIFEIVTMNVGKADASHVENAMGAHNKKYHPSGPSGVRVYTVESGEDAGAYKWVMGPGPWSALDNRPDDPAHNSDWEDNVDRYLEPGEDVEYIRFDPSRSRFPADFNVSKLWVQQIDVARGKMDEMKALLTKLQKVFAEKLPGQSYGIYYNELPSTSSGKDITIVYFFDKYAWLGIDDGLDAKYDEVYGKGSNEAFWNEWRENTVSVETEIWEYDADLSGMPALVKAAERQK
ncbi:MAG: hypothetical protein ABIQ11_01000 [Saprospiraceae bacterium]